MMPSKQWKQRSDCSNGSALFAISSAPFGVFLRPVCFILLGNKDIDS